MAVNDLTFNQLSTLLNAIHKQATGEDSFAGLNTNEFIQVGQAVLKTGYDVVVDSISQVLSKTTFSIRPYSAKFSGLQVSEQRWGAITRKLSIADKDFEDEASLDLTDGTAIDQWTINKPNPLELNFYGINVYAKSVTMFKDQLDHAFQGPDQFASFVTMVVTNANDLLEKAREELARATVANYVAGKVHLDSVTPNESVVHLITEYNALTGLALTLADVQKPENYKPFFQWVDSRVREVASMMTERTQLYHVNITGKEISRHTPMDRMNMYMSSAYKFGIEARVLADVFNDQYLNKFNDAETVNFWQSPDNPTSLNAKATYLIADGTLETTASTVEVNNVFAVLVDQETMGYTLVNQDTLSTGMNAKGKYTNTFWHETAKYWIDYTENGAVFLLD